MDTDIVAVPGFTRISVTSRPSNALTVANSPGAILNWQTFNIGANERVRFEHFTEEFRRQVVAETQESGASISSVALRHKLNANI